MALLNKSEHQIQKDFVKWLETQDIMYTMIPNELGIFKRSPDYFKAINSFFHLGFKPGLPDMLLIVNDQLVFIEFKVGKGKLSPIQKNWIDNLKKTGAHCFVCYSTEEAKQAVDNIAKSKD